MQTRRKPKAHMTPTRMVEVKRETGKNEAYYKKRKKETEGERDEPATLNSSKQSKTTVVTSKIISVRVKALKV